MRNAVDRQARHIGSSSGDNNNRPFDNKERGEAPMAYVCHFCERETDVGHTITIYRENGTEDRLEVLCDPCYADWLHSLKG